MDPKVYLESLEDIFDGDESKGGFRNKQHPAEESDRDLDTKTSDSGMMMVLYVEGMEKASKLLIGFCFKDVFLSWSLSWFSVGPIESYFTLVSREISEGNLSVEERKVLPKQKAAKPWKKKEKGEKEKH